MLANFFRTTLAAATIVTGVSLAACDRHVVETTKTHTGPDGTVTKTEKTVTHDDGTVTVDKETHVDKP